MKRILSKLGRLGAKTKAKAKGPSPPSSTPPNMVPDAVAIPQNLEAEKLGLQAKNKKDGVQENSPLESLPPEVRHYILSILPLGDLNSLIHASPVYFQQYLLRRKALICTSLETTLRNVTVDACAVYRSSSREFGAARSRAAITEYLKSYQTRRSSAHYSILSEELTEDEAVNIAIFHSSVIRPLVPVYTDWAMADLAAQAATDQVNQNPPSRSEEFRLLRGMYRFQLLCNLFGLGQHRRPFGFKNYVESEAIHTSFLCLFEPWEVEEICCVNVFATDKYKPILNDITWDLHEDNPRFDGQHVQQRPPTPDGAFHLHNSYEYDRLLEGTVSRGLAVLHTVLFLVRDHEHLVTTMQQWLSTPMGPFLDFDVMGDTALSARRRYHPSERDNKETRREPLPFLGDHEPPTIIDDTHPPLAWTLLWGDTYSNVYGFYIGDKIRRWGYIFWDAMRLEQTGAKEVLRRQWVAEWQYLDARDDMI